VDEGRKRLEHMRHDPRVALDLLDESDWYTHVSMTGHVESCGRIPTWPTSTAWPAACSLVASRNRAGRPTVDFRLTAGAGTGPGGNRRPGSAEDMSGPSC
jgi:hypothetical protein